MNQKKQLMKNTIIIAIGKLSTQIISYLLLPLYTSQLDPSEYGNYDFVCTLSLFLCPIITLLMEESMFRYLIDADSNRHTISHSLRALKYNKVCLVSQHNYIQKLVKLLL